MKLGGQRIPGKTLVLIASESALIGGGLLFATALRFRNFDALRSQLHDPASLVPYGLVILVCALSLYYYDLYDLQIVSRRAVLFVRLLQALGTACLILAFIYYWDPDLSLGRGIAAVAAPLIIISVSGWRLLVDACAPFLRRNERILVLGDGPVGRSLIEEILRRPELSIDVVGILSESRSYFDSRSEADGAECDVQDEPSRLQYSVRYEALSSLQPAASGLLGQAGTAAAVLDRPVGAIDTFTERRVVFPAVIGSPDDVAQCALENRVDRIVLSLSERRGSMPIQQLLSLKFGGMAIEEAVDMYERTTGRILVDHLAPSWLILADGFRQSRLVLASKRAIDLLFSVVGLALSLPVMALVAAAVYLESGGPVLFRQERVGRNGRHFQILKFRSMRTEKVPVAASWTTDADPRITRVGQFIRKFRLDELPQLINVLRGDMSLVGPRPEQPNLAEMLGRQIPYYEQRHFLRPGITGWAQVKFGYGGTVAENKVKLEHDLFYIKHLSIPLDLAIIFETVKVLLSGRGAK
jgi:lipopolysaccharide/colanic/teichoic acid biosynthesis glycosyltransferase